MFSKATANFVHQIDTDGSLIHVSRVNDSHKLVPTALVIKRKRPWFWQSPKYEPTDFRLGDLLLGEEALNTGVTQIAFLTFNGTYGYQFSGKVEAEGGPVQGSVEGSGTSKLQAYFGQLKREGLNVNELVNSSRNRLVDMEHMLVQQLEKRAELLAVVKERVLTTSSCSITQTKMEKCAFKGFLGMLGSYLTVCVKDSNDIEMDRDVSLEIPSGTVIAYSVMELKIKKDGHYNVSLRDGMNGGFEADSSCSFDFDLDAVDGRMRELPENAPLSAFLNGADVTDLRPLAELPESTRRVFIEKLQETLKDRAALTSLQFVLEALCNGETLEEENGELSEGHNMSLAAILDQSGPDTHSANGHSGVSAPLSAAHLLVSALEELPKESLKILSLGTLQDWKAFDTLMCRLKESSEPLSENTLPLLLQHKPSFQVAERLFDSVKVTLRSGGDCVWAETKSHAGVLPLLLFLSLHGLSVLSSGLE